MSVEILSARQKVRQQWSAAGKLGAVFGRRCFYGDLAAGKLTTFSECKAFLGNTPTVIAFHANVERKRVANPYRRLRGRLPQLLTNAAFVLWIVFQQLKMLCLVLNQQLFV